MSKTMSRREALAHAITASTVAVFPFPALANEGTDAAPTIQDLALQFRDAARALDPRINDCWIGYDEIARGPRDMRVMSIYLSRADTPFVSPPQPRQPTITDLFGQWQDAKYDRVRDAGETDDEGDARFERYAQLQDQITSMRPCSIREAAMQFIVETDDGESEYRPSFFQRLRLIATGI